MIPSRAFVEKIASMTSMAFDFEMSVLSASFSAKSCFVTLLSCGTGKKTDACGKARSHYVPAIPGPQGMPVSFECESPRRLRHGHPLLAG
jgi:hypothetical protein